MARLYEDQGLTAKEYRDIHSWLLKNRDKGTSCQHCGRTDRSLANALVHGKKYDRVPDNYISLCIGCHVIYDTGGLVSLESSELLASLKAMRKHLKRGDIALISKRTGICPNKVSSYIKYASIGDGENVKIVHDEFRSLVDDRIESHRAFMEKYFPKKKSKAIAA